MNVVVRNSMYSSNERSFELITYSLYSQTLFPLDMVEKSLGKIPYFVLYFHLFCYSGVDISKSGKIIYV